MTQTLTASNPDHQASMEIARFRFVDAIVEAGLSGATDVQEVLSDLWMVCNVVGLDNVLISLTGADR